MARVAAPDHVPARPGHTKYYESPPRRREPWRAQRPGDIPGGLPEGPGLGRQGPDQGYALKLVRRFEQDVYLQPRERWEDAAAGCVLVALKRASLFGRAPIKADLEIAFRIWGFLDEAPPLGLIELRRHAFERVEDPHHYLEARRIIDAVPDDVLRATPDSIAATHDRDWASLLDTETLARRALSHDDTYD